MSAATRLALCLSVTLAGAAGMPAVAGANNNALMTTIGTGVANNIGDGGQAVVATLNGQRGIAFLTDGSLLIADTANNRIRKVAPSGVITTVAGNGTAGSGGDGGSATSATLNAPRDVAVGADGITFFIADTGGNRVRKVSGAGVISTLAGNGTSTASGDGSAASSAQLSAFGLGTDADGSLYIADASNHRVRLITATAGDVSGTSTISTFAGTGTAGVLGDDGPATAARVNGPSDVTAIPGGSMLIADTGNHTIRRVDSGGTITRVAGTAGTPCASATSRCGDLGAATDGLLKAPTSVSPDGAGGYLIADTGNNRIRHVLASGTMTTIIGTGTACTTSTFRCGDAGPAEAASLNAPTAAIVSPDGMLYVSDGTNRIRIRISDAGIAGAAGAVGGAGAAGGSGAAGAGGAAGAQGPGGSSGSGGLPGPDGVVGPAGTSGARGADGSTGADGTPAPLLVAFGVKRLTVKTSRHVRLPIFISSDGAVSARIMRKGLKARSVRARYGRPGRKRIDLRRMTRGTYRVAVTLTDGERSSTVRVTVVVR